MTNFEKVKWSNLVKIVKSIRSKLKLQVLIFLEKHCSLTIFTILSLNSIRSL